ncbi:hypothetical protein HOY82DRAFT_543229 [Tuber indicum]|nr:hypothetical protein HOY82DRAFT_543229 [Tuber indicum]
MNNHSDPPTITWIPRTRLQNSATTIHVLAVSEYLTHFPFITVEDIKYANRIVKGLTSNTDSNTRTFAFTVFASMSSICSEEYNAYAALQNGVTAGAVIAHWRIVKAARELSASIPFARGSGDCRDLWRALEKCWGAEIVDGAKVEAGLTVGRGGGGGGRGNRVK